MQKKYGDLIPSGILLVLSFLLYFNTIEYDYVLDDLMVISQNNFTVKGISGIDDIFANDSFTGFFGKEKKLLVGGRYRPLSIATFAIEHEIAGGLNPRLSHVINILLYALSAIMIFFVFRRLFRPDTKYPWFFSVSFIAALLFLVHPVHTEVVANIKGRDEILALLFPLIAWWLILRGNSGNRDQWLYLSLAALMFFLGLLSKENSIAFVALIPLSLFLFAGKPARSAWTAFIVLLVPALLFLFIRFRVLGSFSGGDLPDELLNNPFLGATLSQKFGTIMITLGHYLRLLFFPLILTHDYYPFHIGWVNLIHPFSLALALFYIMLTFYAFFGLKKKSVLSYSLLLYLFPLFIVSNLLFPVGTFMNERFIYLPSLGFVLAVAWFLAEFLKDRIAGKKLHYKLSLSIVLTLVLAGSVRTIARNVVWKDNFTLFTSDVIVSENSVKCNISAGGEWMKKAEAETDSVTRRQMYENAGMYLEKALKLYPKATNGLLLYGNFLALHRQDYKGAIGRYLEVLAINPGDPNAFDNTLKVLNSIENNTGFQYKIGIYRKLNSLNQGNGEANYYLGKLYGQYLNRYDSAVIFLEKAISITPGNTAIYKDLGIVYSLAGDYRKSLDILSRALQLAPDDPQLRQNFLVTRKILESKGEILPAQ